jgi:hypothetical protein
MIPGGGGGGSLEWKFSQVFGERAVGKEIQEGKESITVKFNFNCSQLCAFTPSVPTYSADKYRWGLFNGGQASGYLVELSKSKLTQIYHMKSVNGSISLRHLKILAIYFEPST